MKQETFLNLPPGEKIKYLFMEEKKRFRWLLFQVQYATESGVTLLQFAFSPHEPRRKAQTPRKFQKPQRGKEAQG
jgi:hypothetical protein